MRIRRGMGPSRPLLSPSAQRRKAAGSQPPHFSLARGPEPRNQGAPRRTFRAPTGADGTRVSSRKTTITRKRRDESNARGRNEQSHEGRAKPGRAKREEASAKKTPCPEARKPEARRARREKSQTREERQARAALGSGKKKLQAKETGEAKETSKPRKRGQEEEAGKEGQAKRAVRLVWRGRVPPEQSEPVLGANRPSRAGTEPRGRRIEDCRRGEDCRRIEKTRRRVTRRSGEGRTGPHSFSAKALASCAVPVPTRRPFSFGEFSAALAAGA